LAVLTMCWAIKRLKRFILDYKMLTLTDINAFYGRKQILFDTSVSINDGEKVLLIGPNGAGKSTLLKVITGLIKQCDGNIKFSGKNITAWTTKKRINSGIGYLLQSENIVPGLSVEENLCLGGYTLKREQLIKKIDEVLSIFSFLKDKLQRRAGLLSGGERQALAISMVLMKGPSLLLLDEPSAGLAPKTASDILEHIKKAQHVMGIRAVCMVEHNLKLSLQWAEKVIVLAGGKVVHISESPGQYIEQPEELEKFFFYSSP